MSHVIIEMSDAHNWESFPSERPPQINGEHRLIPTPRRPSVLQGSREAAEKECLRLAMLHPDRKFVVFAPVCAGITAKVPTHTTLSGKVIKEASMPVVIVFQEEEAEGELPF